MKLTKTRLMEIIKEEVISLVEEVWYKYPKSYRY